MTTVPNHERLSLFLLDFDVPEQLESIKSYQKSCWDEFTMLIRFSNNVAAGSSLWEDTRNMFHLSEAEVMYLSHSWIWDKYIRLVAEARMLFQDLPKHTSCEKHWFAILKLDELPAMSVHVWKQTFSRGVVQQHRNIALNPRYFIDRLLGKRPRVHVLSLVLHSILLDRFRPLVLWFNPLDSMKKQLNKVDVFSKKTRTAKTEQQKDIDFHSEMLREYCDNRVPTREDCIEIVTTKLHVMEVDDDVCRYWRTAVIHPVRAVVRAEYDDDEFGIEGITPACTIL